MNPALRLGLAAFFVFSLSLLVRGLYLADGVAGLYTTEQDGTRMARRYDDAALGILHGEGILYPKVWDKEKTGLASRPPGYAMFLATIYAAIGRSFPLVAVVQDVLTSLAAVWIFLTFKSRYGPAAGFIAGLLMAVSPHVAATSNLILADAVAPLPILGAFVIAFPVIAGVELTDRQRTLRLLAMGVLIGAGTWIRPNVLLLGPFAALFLFFLLGRNRRAFWLSALVAVSSLAVVAPITLRNWLIFGEFVPVSINGGITLWQGVADAGGREFGARMWDKQVIAEEAERYGRPDYLHWWAEPEGIARDKDRYRRAMEVIRAKPLWYARAMVVRMGQMMSFSESPPELRPRHAEIESPAKDPVPLPVVPELDSSISEASIGRVADAGSILRSPLRALHRSWLVVAILAWVGIAIAFRSDPRGALFWLVVPIYYLVFESPFLYEWRVAVPMQYFLVPFAARALAQGLEAARRAR